MTTKQQNNAFDLRIEDIQRRHQRERQDLRKSILVEPSPWIMAKFILRSEHVGERELLRGLFLPDREKGRVLWWPARLGSHFSGIMALGIREERRLEIEVNRTDAGILFYTPMERSEPIIASFYKESSVNANDEGFVMIRERVISLREKQISLLAFPTATKKIA